MVCSYQPTIFSTSPGSTPITAKSTPEAKAADRRPSRPARARVLRWLGQWSSSVPARPSPRVRLPPAMKDRESPSAICCLVETGPRREKSSTGCLPRSPSARIRDSPEYRRLITRVPEGSLDTRHEVAVGLQRRRIVVDEEVEASWRMPSSVRSDRRKA